MQRRYTSLLIQGEGWGILYFPPFSPPWFFFRGEKFILHIIWILLMVKCLSFGALLLWQFFLLCHSTEGSSFALRSTRLFSPKKTFSSMCREKNGRPSAKSLFIHYISQNSDSWSFEGQILLNLKNQGMVSSVTFLKMILSNIDVLMSYYISYHHWIFLYGASWRSSFLRAISS